MDSSKLPEGWTRCKLADVLNRSDEKWNPEDGGDHRYLSLKHIEKDTGRILGHGNSSEVDSAKNIFYEGDVLYGKLRPYLNKVAQPSFDGVCSTDILVFSSSPSIDSGFLKHRLRATDVVQYADRRSSGINLPRISPDDLGEFEIALPPLAEQRRIADRLDAIQSHAQKARETLANAPSSIDEYRQSVLNAALTGQLTADWRADHPDVEPADELLNSLAEERRKRWEKNYRWERYDSKDKKPPSGWKDRYKPPQPPKFDDFPEPPDLPESWEWVSLEALETGDRSTTYGVVKAGEHDPDGVRLLKSGQVREGFLDLTEEHRISPEKDEQYSRTKLRGGEILLNLVGASIGRSAVVPEKLEGANVTRAIAVLPLFKELSPWVQHFLEGPHGQLQIRIKSTGSAQDVLNLGETKSICVPLPPVEEQREIIRRVRQRLDKIDQMAKHVEQARERLDHLDRSVLAKAFRGELVETEAERAQREGRDYETAEELLARISEDDASSDGAKASNQQSNGQQLEMDM